MFFEREPLTSDSMEHLDWPFDQSYWHLSIGSLHWWVWVTKSWWKVEVGSALQVHVKCPLLLSKKHPVTDAIFNYCHQAVVHGGRGQTWQRTNVESVRILGYWWKFSLQNDNPYLFDMMKTKCNIRKEKTIDLFAQRIMEPQSFTYCGLDLFGPFYIMEKRSEIKIMLCYVHMYG